MRDVEVFKEHRHAPRFDLRQIEDPADQRQQMFAGGVDLAEVRQEIVLAEVLAFFLQQFRITDDRVQRRAQFMRHVGEELGFVARDDLEFLRLRLEFVEQTRVVDRDDRLICEGLQDGLVAG